MYTEVMPSDTRARVAALRRAHVILERRGACSGDASPIAQPTPHTHMGGIVSLIPPIPLSQNSIYFLFW